MNIIAKLKSHPTHPLGTYDLDQFKALGLTEEITAEVNGKKHTHIAGKALQPGDQVTFGDAQQEILWRHGIHDLESFKEKLGWMFDVVETAEASAKKKQKEPKIEGGE